MSLSRILNDEPAPGRPQFAQPAQHPDLAEPPHHRSESYGNIPPLPPLPRHLGYSEHGPSNWDSYRSRDEVANRVTRSRSPPAHHEQPDDQDRFRKRRDQEYQHSAQKRSAHKTPAMHPEIIAQRDEHLRQFIPDRGSDARPSRHADEAQRLASSDLEDCEEVWIGELSEYIMDSQKRLKQVEQWFNESMKERTSITAQRVSHYYGGKIARIPGPRPSSPPMMSLDGGPSMNGYSEPNFSGSRLPESNGQGHHEFESATYDDDVAMGSARRSTRGWDVGKRPASGPISDHSSDEDVVPTEKQSHTSKKRKIEAIPDEVSVSGLSTGPLELGVPGPSTESVQLPDEANISKSSRKKPTVKRRSGLDMEMPPIHPPSVSDITPSISRPSSPAPTASVIFELDETIPPMRKAKKMDDGAITKRLRALEEAQRKVWTNIARRDVAKVYKYHALGFQARQSQAERIAKLASIQARRPFTKTAKAVKDTQTKAKRLMREMQVFWKKNEREERDVRKREHKEAMDRLKMEEEKREAARQARKLEFLISQTELYSHFVGNKLKTADIEGEGDSAATLETPAAAAADVAADVNPESLQEIDFDDEDKTNLYNHARHNAQEAIALAKLRAQEFDTQAALERRNNEALQLARADPRPDATSEEGSQQGSTSGEPKTTGLMDLDSEELNFQNPTSLSGPLTVQQPKMLMAQLKEYQLKGLNWLATLYEQGINGILADEMGLGKTIQSISLLSYLAEVHDIWGPFLVVAPLSTLHNWQQELTRFTPGLKALPYWGNVKDRATLRKFWSKKEISYNQDAPFHVLITSYQLVTQDQQYFQRVKWQYMILDEAQNIKNSSSARWKTLLGFHCRNRLLLTGTPIQNSMQELWALLHFIMPSLFDSHDEFNEWFSKDIENAAENKGSKLNEHQLRRLHMILKPFMLRRIKKNVQNELSEKIEIDIYVDMSARQRSLYKALLAKVSVADLIAKAANIGDADSARVLMNLVMQFRKVCNHPELFERADVVSPFSFAHFGRSGPLMREGDFLTLSYSTQNPIKLNIPELFYLDGGIINVPRENSQYPPSCLHKLLNIWSTDWIHRSLYEHEESSSFSFLRFLDMSPREAHHLHVAPLIRRRLLALQKDNILQENNIDLVVQNNDPLHMSTWHPLQQIESRLGLSSITLSAWSETCLSRPGLKWFVPPVVAPAITMYCTDRTFLESQARLREGSLEALALYGLPASSKDSEETCNEYRSLLPGLSPAGILETSPSYQTPTSPMQIPEAKRLIYDSAKLARLDSLLQELKAGDHRVLVYFQMTRMMDLMEEYLIYRQYKYLRLDGSSKLEDRRDMVIDWQTRPDIFVFLLSTRAGGLGINLTAADTVVFYDHDWNPSNDAQAMDRAHRLGQTRQVTVYRLITRGTIDERIVELARVKKDVQDIVVGSKTFTDVAKPSEIVHLLLNDEQLAGMDTSAALPAKDADDKTGEGEPIRDLWNDEGDDFFGHSTATATVPVEDDIGTSVATGAGKGKKPKKTRGPRKVAGKKRGANNEEDA
ncbi:SNF2 family DNA-dependent ATPase [Mycena floridula]|nr:SNF2 family DNA-dependent ATPase [Mycena floridula]